MFRPMRLMLFLSLVCGPALGQSLQIPPLTARVTDLAGVLSAEEMASLESKLRDLESTDSTQVGVLIIPSLEGQALEDYSIRVAEAWKLGQKGRDNGAILLVAMKDRKVRIEVGYGLETTLTDARSFQITQNEILPHFRQGDFYGGIDAGVTAMAQVVRGVYQGPPRATRTRSERSGMRLDWIVLMLFFLVPVLSWTGKWGGGVLGTGAGALLPHFLLGGGMIPLLLGGAIGGALGMFLGSLIQAGAGRSGMGRGGFGGPFWWGGGGGGSLGGGGFGGFGGSGGGGFSGGGGSFGGGGSSGSW
jgi:uncharacterized protein